MFTPRGLYLKMVAITYTLRTGPITPTLTPQEAIQKLIDTINNMDISKGTKTELKWTIAQCYKTFDR